MTPPLSDLITNKKALIVVVGEGYVGLPQTLALIEAGFSVVGLDADSEKINSLQEGSSYIDDISDERLRKCLDTGQLKFSTDPKIIQKANVVFVCVPTPLTIHKTPDMTAINSARDDIVENLQPPALVVLESTTYPGTTEEVLLPSLLEKGFKIGEDLFLAHSPERVDPGNKKFDSKNTPKVVGGVTKECTKLTRQVYETFNKDIVEVSSPRAAEMTKILENIFRLVNISMVNELALLADRMGIDIWEVIEAAKTKPYGFKAFYPGPGIGGHCIPLDPYYLSWKAREHNFFTRFIEYAGEINDQMPHYTVTKVGYALNSHKKAIRGSKIMALGVTYKADVSDIRESPAIMVMELLKHKGAEVSYHDPLVKELELKGVERMYQKGAGSAEPEHLVSRDLDEVNTADLVLILTAHTDMDYEKVAQNAKLVVDTRNAIKDRSHKHVYRF